MSQAAQAGQVWLENGDRVSGEPLRFEAGNLIWQSSLFGELKISLKKLSGFSSEQPLDVSMGDEGMLILHRCAFAYAPGQAQWLHCEDGSTQLAGFSRIKKISREIIEAPSYVLNGDAHLAMAATSGNTSSQSYNAGASSVLRHEDVRHSGYVNVVYEELENVKSKDQQEFGYKFDYFISPVWFLNANASYESDEFKDLSSRITLGAGGGYQFFDTEQSKLSTEAGIAYVQDKFIVAEDDNHYAMRVATSYRVLTGYYDTELVHTNELFLPPDQAQNWNIKTTTSLRIPLVGNLNSLLKYQYDYDNAPTANTSKSDSKLLIGIDYVW